MSSATYFSRHFFQRFILLVHLVDIRGRCSTLPQKRSEVKTVKKSGTTHFFIVTLVVPQV